MPPPKQSQCHAGWKSTHIGSGKEKIASYGQQTSRLVSPFRDGVVPRRIRQPWGAPRMEARLARHMTENLEWLLEDLLRKTQGARYALVLSRDGLKLCHTSHLAEDQGTHLAAIAAGVQSLAQAASVH